jgi:DNA-binding XRE family transcriptional regulator
MRTISHHPNMLWISRKQSGLAQKSVARFLGHKTTSVISEYENGKLLPNIRTALKLCAIYNKSLRDLYPTLYNEVQEQISAAMHIRSTNRAAVPHPPL